MSRGTAFNQALAGIGQQQGSGQHASAIGQDRLVRKEVSLGIIRDREPPQGHIGLTIAPFMDVATDDVVFSYLGGLSDGLAPARADQAEAELAQKDENAVGQGRASVIDWSLKDHYDASDVNKARELQKMVEQLNAGQLPMFVNSATEDWAAKITRDRNLRLRKLDNRIEKLIIDAVANGTIVYDDGRIKFAVDYARPNSQQAGHADNDIPEAQVVNGAWDMTDSAVMDPIRFFNGVKQFMWDKYQVTMDRVIGSKKFFNLLINSDKFSQRAGLGSAWTGSTQGPPDPLYLIDGWGPEAVRALLQRVCDITFIEYDSVYRTRPIGQTTITNNRFMPVNRLVFLPKESDMTEVDGTQIGFAKTLTSPHPEGNWGTGYYEWERSTVDPWGQDMGNGIKAFPVFPYMEYTYACNATHPTLV